MQLASTQEYQEWALAVPDIMTYPTIRTQGALVQNTLSTEQAADVRGSQQGNEIQDVYPWTPLHSGLVALSSRYSRAYWGKFTLKDSLANNELDRFWNV